MKFSDSTLPWWLFAATVVALVAVLIHAPSMNRSELLDARFVDAQNNGVIYQHIWAEADARVFEATDAVDELKQELTEERRLREKAESCLAELLGL